MQADITWWSNRQAAVGKLGTSYSGSGEISQFWCKKDVWMAGRVPFAWTSPGRKEFSLFRYSSLWKLISVPFLRHYECKECSAEVRQMKFISRESLKIYEKQFHHIPKLWKAHYMVGWRKAKPLQFKELSACLSSQQTFVPVWACSMRCKCVLPTVDLSCLSVCEHFTIHICL